MNTSIFPPSTDVRDVGDAVAADLATDGYAIVTAALPASLLDALLAHLHALDPAAFQPAGIGRSARHQLDPSIRGDIIHWLEPDNDATRAYLAWIDALRLELNRRLFLGLFDYECHYACYPPGAHYRRHVDAFKDESSRVVTTVLYLNPQWQPQDGGELLLYRPDGAVPIARIPPVYGTLVLFLSADFPHEVATARRTRHSVSGWFRLNNTQGGTIDPPR